MERSEKKPDLILALARSHAGKRRKRSGWLILVAFGIVGAGFFLMAWLNWPEPEPPRLLVIAADGVTAVGAPVTLRAWLRPEKEKDQDALLDGHDLFFADSVLVRLDGQANKGFLEKATTGGNGEAHVEWKPSNGPPPSIVVRHPDKSHPAFGMARVFVWPAASRILVVEARHGMMAADTKTFEKAHDTQISPHPGVAQALQQAKAKGYVIAYLATVPNRPEGYGRLRGWLQRVSPRGQARFPDGPALSRSSYAENSAGDVAIQKALEDLKRRFKGPIVGVVGRAQDAGPFQKEGVSAYLVGQPRPAAAEVKHVKSWQDLVNELP
jgi:hypothetical protein